MTSFRKALNKRLLSVAKVATPKVVLTYDDKIPDALSVDDTPCLICFARNKEKESEEIGSRTSNWNWSCHIYYLDISKPTETWDDADDRRDTIMQALEDYLEGNHFLNDGTGPFANKDAKGVLEVPYLVQVTAGSFDQSGQEGYYTITAEMYVSVHTSKS